MNDDVDVTLLASNDKGRIGMTRGIDKITSSTFDNLSNDIRTMVDRTRRIERWSIRSLGKRIDSMLFERTAIAHKPELSWLESDVGSTTQKTTQKIIELIIEDPFISRKEMAARIGDITEDSVKYHLDRMKKQKIIKRIDPDKGSHWEVVDDE